MIQKKIFITGSTGFLGRILTKRLLSFGYDVITDRSQNYRIDISKPFELLQDFDIVIHCAGKAHTKPRSKEEEKLFYDVNYIGTINLANAINALPKRPRSFIFISTVSVYGIEQGEKIREDHPLNGQSPYARSKILAEKFLTEWASQNRIVLTILRLPLIAGPTPPGNLGAMINAIKKGRYLSIGKADARKSIVWADDIATVIYKVSKIGGIYNLADSYHPSFNELEKSISNELGRRFPIKIPLSLAKLLAFAGNLVGENAPINTDKLMKITSTLTFDIGKAEDALDWKPSKVLDRINEIL